MIRLQANRARDYYRRSHAANSLLSPAGRGIFRVMSSSYRQLLEEVNRAGPDVLVRASACRRRKGMILLRGWAARWGWD